MGATQAEGNSARLVKECSNGNRTPFAFKLKEVYYCSLLAGSRVCRYQGPSEKVPRCTKLSPYDIGNKYKGPVPLVPFPEGLTS